MRSPNSCEKQLKYSAMVEGMLIWNLSSCDGLCLRGRDDPDSQPLAHFHDWLEGRGPEGCLMDMVDDATSTVLGQLGDQETIWAAANVLGAWIGEYGVPIALYTDWKNVYKREPTEKELLAGDVPVTQFGRMCERLG